MSLVSGIVGAVMGSNAQEDATQAQKDIAAQQLAYQKQLQAPYYRVGQQGLAKLYGQDVTYADPAMQEKYGRGATPTGSLVDRIKGTVTNMYTQQEAEKGGIIQIDENTTYDPKTGLTTIKGSGSAFDLFTDPVTGKKISYEDMVANQLGAFKYEQSPEYLAQNALGQQALARQSQARGLEFSAPASSAARSAELSQKLTAADYGRASQNYRQDLVNRYNALRSQNAAQYDFLTQQANLGLGATTALGGAGQTAAAAQAAAAQQSGQANAQFWSGLGGASAQTANLGLKAYDYGSKNGWFGNNTAGGIDTSNLGSGSIEGVGAGFWD